MKSDFRTTSPFPTPGSIPQVRHEPLESALPTSLRENQLPQTTGAIATPPLHTYKAARARVLGSSPSASALPQISAERLKTLIDEARQAAGKGTIDLASLLEHHGFRKTLAGIDFSDRNTLSLKGLKLDGIDFDKCRFDWSHLSDSEIKDCRFSGCTLGNVSFMNSRLRDCTFTNCTFTQAMFLHADLSKVKFIDSTFENGSFEDANIADSLFSKVKMPGTHFLNTSVSKTDISQSDLTDTVFFGKKELFTLDAESAATAKLVKPITASLVPHESRGISVPRVGEKICEIAQTNLVRIAMQSPLASKEAIDHEVEAILRHCIDTPSSGNQPLPQRLLQVLAEHPETYPNASAFVAKTKVLGQHVDSIVLPGGEDVSPLLYGEEIKGAKWDGDYRRSLMELGLIHESVHKEIPFMSICRGFQMTSVYFGAKLRQHIGNEVGVRVLTSDAASSPELYGIKLDNMRVAVYHHQAVPSEKLPGMTTVLTRPIEHDGETFDIVMMLGGEHGAPRMALQNHPEFLDHITSTPAQTNEKLIELGNAWQRPGSQESGLHDPADMVNSGILSHMSAENDDVWKVIAAAAKTRRTKAGINDATLVQTKQGLRTPEVSLPAYDPLEQDTEVDAAELSLLRAVAGNQNLPAPIRREAEQKIQRHIVQQARDDQENQTELS